MKITFKQNMIKLGEISLALLCLLGAAYAQNVPPPITTPISKDTLILYYNPNNGFHINFTFNKVLITSGHSYVWVMPDGMLADIDGNGLLDIPFTTYLGNQAYIAYQTSLGNFNIVNVLSSSGYTYGYAIADLNGDGRKDLVFPSGYNSVYILINTGAGFNTISFIVGSGSGVNHATSIGNLAIVSNDPLFSGSTYIYNFSLNSYISITSLSEGIIAADINNDGKKDIVLTSGNYAVSSLVQYYLNTGNWTSWNGPYNITPGSTFHEVRVGDFDNDGKIDIVTCNADDNVYIYKNNGGNPPAFSFYASINTGSNLGTCELQVADMDCDNDLDIVWSANYLSTANPIGWIENLGGGSFANHIIETGTYAVYGIGLGDINNDGRLDIAAGLDVSLYVYYRIDGPTCVTPINFPEKPSITVSNKNVKFSYKGLKGNVFEVYSIDGKLIMKERALNDEVEFYLHNKGVYILKYLSKFEKFVVR
jgi:hypothetical protein